MAFFSHTLSIIFIEASFKDIFQKSNFSYIYLYHLTSLLMHAIGSKVRIK